MSKPLVSIIVPVYKVEDYLCECVDSLLAQTYPNIEIVLVDDGSPDGCGEICDAYAARDSRVHAFHKENGGLSDARNFGLRCAHGELISFVDSDDWVSPVFIEALEYAMERSTTYVAAVPGGRYFRDGDDIQLIRSMTDVRNLVQAPINSHEIIRQILYQSITTGAQWRLYERSILGNDPFPVGLYYEDLASTYKFVQRAGNVALVNSRELYAYRLRATSIIRQAYSSVKARSALTVAKQLYCDITEWYPDLAAAASSRSFSVCRMVYAQALTGHDKTKQTERDRAELWAVIKHHRNTVLRDSSARKRERLAALIACFGKQFFSLFCSLARKFGFLQ